MEREGDSIGRQHPMLGSRRRAFLFSHRMVQREDCSRTDESETSIEHGKYSYRHVVQDDVPKDEALRNPVGRFDARHVQI